MLNAYVFCVDFAIWCLGANLGSPLNTELLSGTILGCGRASLCVRCSFRGLYKENLMGRG